MQIQLPQNLVRKLSRELGRAGRREIGGVLVGEALGPDEFKIIDLSVQRSGGGTACFVRHPDEHRAFLESFFDRTGHRYSRFNYLGEWHSHPSFVPAPSSQDLHTMQSMISDSKLGAPFAILMIAKLAHPNSLELSAVRFTRDFWPQLAQLDFPKMRGICLKDVLANQKWRVRYCQR